MAQDSTASIRLRRRDAVSVLFDQIGTSTRSTSCVVISCNSILPSSGLA